jgi:DNA-binding NtrC family response regulator
MVGTRSVLLVDEEQSSRRRYADWIGDEFRVRTAGSRIEARAKSTRAVDVVLVSEDLATDRFVDRLRRITDGCHVVGLGTVVGTAGGRPDADVWLTNPPTRSELETTVDRYLTKATFERALRSFYSLVSIKARLETELDHERLTDNAGYGRICRRVDELDAELADMSADLDTDWAGLFEVCESTSGGESRPVP